MKTIISGTAFAAIMFASMATAQTAPSTDEKAEKPDSMMTIGTMFYSDPEMTAMRSEAEIKASWAALSSEDQEKAKTACAAHKVDAGAMTDTTSPEGMKMKAMTDACAIIETY